MALIDDLIHELPKEIREMVRAHLRIIVAMELDELRQWLAQIGGQHWNGAYQTLNQRMTPEERIVEQDRLNALIAYYNKENKIQADMWRNFFYVLIAIAIQSVSDEIIGPGS